MVSMKRWRQALLFSAASFMVLAFQNCAAPLETPVTIETPSPVAKAASCEWDPNDGNNWAADETYWKTLQHADVDGDGLQDFCGRGACGIYCARNDGRGLGPFAKWTSSFGDAEGWNHPQYAETIRFANVDGDSSRKADVCGRAADGIHCAVSNGAGFGGSSRWSASFADAAGWSSDIYWPSLRLADVSGDGRADVCGRGGSGIYCAVSNGAGFGGLKLWTSSFNNSQGWATRAANEGFRYLNVASNDAKMDVCARANDGRVVCALSTGSAFGPMTRWQTSFDSVGDLGSDSALPPGQPVTIAEVPDAASAIAACRPSSFELGECVNRLVYEKSANEKLRILLAPGNYALRSTIFIFDRKNIEIVGKAGPTFTKVSLGAGIHAPDASSPYSPIDSYFSVSVVDSSDVTVRDIGFSGSDDGAQRGFAACATEGREVNGLSIRGNTASGFGNFFAIIGQAFAYADHYMANLPADTRHWSNRPWVQEFMQRLGEVPASPLRRGCVGSIRNVRFTENTMDLRNVGFYTAMYSRIVGQSPLIAPDNWAAAAEDFSGRNTNYYVARNSFRIEPDCGTHQCHSAMKWQGQRGVLIEDNVIDTRLSRDAFGAGAAINIAFEMVDVAIRGNRILFPIDHRYAWQGISFAAGFNPHKWYGVGDLTSVYPSGDYGLTTPAFNVRITGNTLVNTGIRFLDNCSPGLGKFCRSLDQWSGGTNGRLTEKYVVTGNAITPPSCTRTGLGVRIDAALCATDSPFDFVSRSERQNSWGTIGNCSAEQSPSPLAADCDPGIPTARQTLKARIQFEPAP